MLWKLLLLILCLLAIEGSAGNEEGAGNLQLITNITTSICPWSINMTIECTVNGNQSDTTVWKGSAFDECNSKDVEIVLLHTKFVTASAIMCNNGGMIYVQSVNVTMGNDSNHYTSQLVVIVRSGMIGKVVLCSRDNGTNTSLVGSISLNVNTSIIDNIICMHTSTLSLSTSTYMDMGTVEAGSGPEVLNILVTFGVFVLLFLLLLATIPLLLLGFKFRKRSIPTHNTDPKAPLPEESTHHPVTNRNEVKSYIDVTLKAFDNENMGIYNLGDESLDDVTVLKTDSSRKDETLVCDLNSLMHTLRGPFSSKWYSFGLAIGVPKDILNHIKHHSDSDEECLIEVLDYWLRNHSSKPTWEEVTEAKRKVNSNSIF